MWMKTIQQDLKSNNLSLTEAIYPIHRIIHSGDWCLRLMLRTSSGDLTWFIQHRRCIGPHVDAMSACLELMLQPLPRLIPFFEDPYSLHLSSLSLVYQVFSWILQLPTGELASEFVLYPFLRHDLAIAIFFPESRSLEVFALFFSVSPRLWLYPSTCVYTMYNLHDTNVSPALIILQILKLMERHLLFVLVKLEVYIQVSFLYKPE